MKTVINAEDVVGEVIRNLASYTATDDLTDMSAARKGIITLAACAKTPAHTEFVEALWTVMKTLQHNTIDDEDDDEELPTQTRHGLSFLVHLFIVDGCRRILRNDMIRCKDTPADQPWGEWRSLAEFIADLDGTTQAEEYNLAAQFARNHDPSKLPRPAREDTP